MMKTKIFFFGTPEIAVPSLVKLAKNDSIEIVGVGVFPDRPVGRKRIYTPCPVKRTALDLKLPIFEITNKNDLENIFKTQIFDLGIVIAFGMIFPESILEIPSFGVINVHFSLLPRYRGASPVQSAILNGDSISGITIQKMVKALDAGDIYLQETYPISDMGTQEVFTIFAELTAQALPKFITQLSAGKIIRRPQDPTQATFCGKFTKADGEIFPEKETATVIYQKYLAFNIWPGVYISTSLGNIKLKQITLTPTDASMQINCADETILYVQTLQIPGKQVQAASIIKNGYPNLFQTT